MCRTNINFPNELNKYFGRFEALNTTRARKSIIILLVTDTVIIVL